MGKLNTNEINNLTMGKLDNEIQDLLQDIILSSDRTILLTQILEDFLQDFDPNSDIDLNKLDSLFTKLKTLNTLNKKIIKLSFELMNHSNNTIT